MAKPRPEDPTVLESPSINVHNEVDGFPLVDTLPDAPPLPPKRMRGREKGSRREQRSISRVRNALAMMLERNVDQYEGWFTEAAKDNPLKALILMKDLAEYFMPKLGRIEQTGTVEHKVSHFVPLIEREPPPKALGESEALEAEFTEVKRP